MISVDYNLGVTLCPQPGPHNKSQREQQRAGVEVETGVISLSRLIIIPRRPDNAIGPVTDAAILVAAFESDGRMSCDGNYGIRSRICLVFTVAV
ncbi:MAG TPA: hypothetical protein VF131_15655 [Blastocatellia bacterium]|nr:hypothetical protein [Blastocatellia bacterium]